MGTPTGESAMKAWKRHSQYVRRLKELEAEYLSKGVDRVNAATRAAFVAQREVFQDDA